MAMLAWILIAGCKSSMRTRKETWQTWHGPCNWCKDLIWITLFPLLDKRVALTSGIRNQNKGISVSISNSNNNCKQKFLLLIILLIYYYYFFVCLFLFFFFLSFFLSFFFWKKTTDGVLREQFQISALISWYWFEVLIRTGIRRWFHASWWNCEAYGVALVVRVGPCRRFRYCGCCRYSGGNQLLDTATDAGNFHPNAATRLLLFSVTLIS